MMCRTLIKLILFSLVVLLFGSCNLINPTEPQPSYLTINHMLVTSKYITQGTNSSKVKDVWVYVDGSYIGTFELPAKVPVLSKGVHHVELGAGIYINGISATREAYSLYKYYANDINLAPGKTSLIDTAIVSYFPDLQYTWFEDFEGSGFSLDTLSTSLGKITLDSTNAFEGHGCLHLALNSTDTIIECVSNNYYQLPKGDPDYLEMNYKCDEPFVVGMMATDLFGVENKYIIITLNTSPDWNKIYIKLTPTVDAVLQTTGFKMYFGALLVSGASTGNIYLDNLKLIYK